MQMRAIIAEDEPVARQAIVDMAKSSGISVLAECEDGAEVIHRLQTLHPDILFLDVEMPGIDGFGVLQDLPADFHPAVIFTTAYDRYAVQAFEQNAVDYLLKPFDQERFGKAVDRAKSRIRNLGNHSTTKQSSAGQVIQFRPPQYASQKLLLRSKGKLEIVRVDDIDWVEAQHNYVQLHVGNSSHTFRQTIQELESRLHPENFLRIHRSLIVNVERIHCLQACGYGEYLVVLKNGKSLPLSRSYRDRLDTFLERISASTLPPEIGR